MIRLTTPVLIEQMLALAVGFSDRLLTGHYLETPHLAAITTMAYIVWLMHGTFSFIAIGSTARVARNTGAGQPERACRVVGQSLLIGVVVAAAAAAFWFFLGRAAMHGLQLQGDAAQLADEYIRIIVPSIPFIMITAISIACWRGAGHMVIGLIIMSIVNLVNLGLSWSLVLGWGPFPELGWKGVAIGTSVGYVAGGSVAAILLIWGKTGLRVRRADLRPDMPVLRRILRIGVPGGLDMFLIIGCQLWFLSLINRLGTLATAAHGVALCIESFGFVPAAAFQMAATTLAGQYLGARDPRRAARSVWMAFAVGGGFMAVVGAVFFFYASQLPWLFLKPDQIGVAEQAAPLLRVISVAMPAIAAMMIFNGGLRGAGDTRWPLAFSLVGFLGVRIPMTYLLCFGSLVVPLTGWTLVGWNLGVLGAWIAMATDVSVRASLLVGRFFHGGWTRIEV